MFLITTASHEHSFLCLLTSDELQSAFATAMVVCVAHDVRRIGREGSEEQAELFLSEGRAPHRKHGTEHMAGRAAHSRKASGRRGCACCDDERDARTAAGHRQHLVNEGICQNSYMGNDAADALHHGCSNDFWPRSRRLKPRQCDGVPAIGGLHHQFRCRTSAGQWFTQRGPGARMSPPLLLVGMCVFMLLPWVSDSLAPPPHERVCPGAEPETSHRPPAPILPVCVVCLLSIALVRVCWS